MFPENALGLGYPVVVTDRNDKDIEIFAGEVSCREIKSGIVNYLLKPDRGEARWFTHDEITNGYLEEENVE